MPKHAEYLHSDACCLHCKNSEKPLKGFMYGVTHFYLITKKIALSQKRKKKEIQGVNMCCQNREEMMVT